MKKSKLETDIFNYTTPEFFINMKNIPMKGSDERKDFVLEEKRKCREGINVNGIYIPGSLYFHLNYYKLAKDVKNNMGKTVKDFALPDLRDNEWIVFNDYEKAQKELKSYTLFGLRQAGKSELECSICLREICLYENTEALALFSGVPDRDTFVKKMKIAIENGEKFIIIPNIDQDWNKGLIRFGVTKVDNKVDVRSSLYIYNTQEGNKIQVGSGKALKNDSLLYYEDKISTIGECKIGDKIYGRDGNLTKVLGVYPQGIVNLYEIELFDGRKIKCSGDHLWTVNRTDKIKNKTEILNTEFLFNNYKRNYFNKKLNKEVCVNRYTIPDIESVNYPEKNILINPYYLGLFAGDGTTKNPSHITTIDYEIIEFLKKYANELGGRLLNKSKFTYKISNNENGKHNPLNTFFKYYNLVDNKHIPKDYLYNSHYNRLEVLKGICDSDGYVDRNGKISISLSHEVLANDVVQLIRSLGINCTVTTKKTSYFNKKYNKQVQCKLAYVIYIGSSNLELFKLKRKLERQVFKKRPCIGIESIIKIESGEATCIKVDNEDSLFLTNDFIPTHNTPTFVLMDEIGKTKFKLVYDAVEPALLDDFGGLRCSPLFTFTGGERDKSVDAENMIRFPNERTQLCYDYNGKVVGGRFLDGRYRKDCKEFTEFSNYIGKKTNTWLDKYPIKVTNLEKAEEIINIERVESLKSPDKKSYILKKIFYPLTLEDVFLSENENPFPREALEQQKQFLLSNPIGQNIELFRGLNGNVQFKFSNKLPISSYPVQTGDNLDAPIVMYDSPEKFKGQKGIHIISCLPTGEKVMTNSGLQNIENVKLTDKLINENGNLVNIKNIQIHSVKKENIFQFKLTNTLRTTTFTGEHPLLVSENKTKYVSIDKWKRLEIKQRYKSYDFKFKKAENIKEKEWLKIPNLYNKEILPNFDLLWNDFKCNNCKKITNPLEDKDFWWLVGLWLGDGWIFKNGIQFVFNNKEIYYIEKFKKVSEKLFNKTPTFCKDIGGAITFSIYSKQIRTFFLKNLGEYSYGKKISEWIKYLPKKYKLEIVKGYLNSDGCVSVSKKNKGLINFVSINLELLESVQDILFSTGIISSIKLLRNEGFVTINKKVSKTKRCYILDLCLSETINLLEQLYEIDDPKTSKLNILDKNIKKRDSGCRFDETKDYIYFQITDITKGLYTGDVYNFECDTHTFCSHHITTHNCDTFNDDEAPNSDSLGSIYVIRKDHSDLSDPFNGCMVASYTARPKTMKKFNKTCLMLAEFYDGQIMYEHTGGAFKDFFEGENKLHLLIDTPSLTKEISPNSKAGNTKGLRATPGIQKHALNLTLDYLNEELPNGQLGTTRIMDVLLIDEMLAYDGVKNTDRYIAFSMGMEALYMYKKYTTIVNYQEENVKPEPKVKFDAFGNVRKSGNVSNAFGF